MKETEQRARALKYYALSDKNGQGMFSASEMIEYMIGFNTKEVERATKEARQLAEDELNQKIEYSKEIKSLKEKVEELEDKMKASRVLRGIEELTKELQQLKGEKSFILGWVKHYIDTGQLHSGLKQMIKTQLKTK